VQIIDKYGYLDSALDYIERNIVSGKGLQKTARKSGVNEDLLSSLSLSLKNFSEKRLFSVLQEKIEDRRGILPGADIEISGANVSLDVQKNKAFILMDIFCEMVVDGQSEDKIKITIKIYSKNKIQIYAG